MLPHRKKSLAAMFASVVPVSLICMSAAKADRSGTRSPKGWGEGERGLVYGRTECGKTDYGAKIEERAEAGSKGRESACVGGRRGERG